MREAMVPGETVPIARLPIVLRAGMSLIGLSIGFAVGFAIGCGNGDEEGGGTVDAVLQDAGGDTVMPEDPGTPSDEGRVDPEVSPDVGPGCTSDAECADFFDDLTVCEKTRCNEKQECERTFVAEGTACDDGDPCTGSDECTSDPSGKLVCAGHACDDGDVCNGVETCGEDGCVPGQAPEYPDGDKCNGEETCDPVQGVLPGKPLDCPADGDPCNGAEHCDPAAGCTAGDPPVCDDGSDCTKDACVANVGCAFSVEPGKEGCCKSDVECFDENPCTAGSCNDKGACVVTNVDGPCETGDPCATSGTCTAGKCVAETAEGCTVLCTLSGKAGATVGCPVGLAAIGAGSPPAAKLLFTVGYQADAVKKLSIIDTLCVGSDCAEVAIPGASTSLQPSGHNVFLTPSEPAEWDGKLEVEIVHLGFAGEPITGAYYDGETLDGDPSVFDLRFVLLAETKGVPVVLHSVVASGAGETALTAKLVDGVIVTTDTPCGEDVCFDGKVCTNDSCDGGACKYPFGEGGCDDGNPCTVGDACDPEGDCVAAAFAESGTACAGEDKCNEVGACDGIGKCVLSGAPKTCAEKPCAVAECDPGTGECVYGPDLNAACDDGDACTENDACDSLAKCTGTKMTCKDTVGCTADACDKVKGCVFIPQNVVCEDSNPCTQDACDPAAGCTHEPVEASCDDGDACTSNDACQAGLCKGSADPTCGCGSTPMCAPLDDKNPCNGTIACIDGQCKNDPATVVKCPANGYQCMVDWTCNPASGACEGTAMTCDDGLECTQDACKDGKCIHTPTANCPVGWICAVSGKKGVKKDCALRLARAKAADPIPVSADMKLHFDSAKVKLTDFFDKLCLPSGACGEVIMVKCSDATAGTGCTVSQTLKPSGHSLLLEPADKAKWAGAVTMSIYHAGALGKALTEAYVDDGAVTGGDSDFLFVRFELLEDVSSDNPVLLEVSKPAFSPQSGLKLGVDIKDIGGNRLFVAKAQ